MVSNHNIEIRPINSFNFQSHGTYPATRTSEEDRSRTKLLDDQQANRLYRASPPLALPLLFVQTFEHLPLSMALGSRLDHQNLGGAMAHLAHPIDLPLFLTKC